MRFARQEIVHAIFQNYVFFYSCSLHESDRFRFLNVLVVIYNNFGCDFALFCAKTIHAACVVIHLELQFVFVHVRRSVSVNSEQNAECTCTFAVCILQF